MNERGPVKGGVRSAKVGVSVSGGGETRVCGKITEGGKKCGLFKADSIVPNCEALMRGWPAAGAGQRVPLPHASIRKNTPGVFLTFVPAPQIAHHLILIIRAGRGVAGACRSGMIVWRYNVKTDFHLCTNHLNRAILGVEAGEQNILRLDISVRDVLRVAVRQRAQERPHAPSRVLLPKPPVRDDAVKHFAPRNLLEDQEEGLRFLVKIDEPMCGKMKVGQRNKQKKMAHRLVVGRKKHSVVDSTCVQKEVPENSRAIGMTM